jgi:septum formation protein
MLIIQEKFKNTKIILASRSPRRQYLMRELGLQFETSENGSEDESFPGSLSKKEIPVYLAVKKSDGFLNLLDKSTLLITADTIVWCDRQVLGKPEDRDEAVRILEKISGRKHQVITGVCLRNQQKTVTFHSLTSVFFRQLSGTEIDYYVDNFKPYDKAGAYGIQEWIGYAGIKKIRGSYFNVMGLPTEKLYKNLIEF